MKYLILVLLISGCSFYKKREPATQVPAEPTALELYNDAVERLQRFTVGGFIVSLKNENQPEHMGESILYLGIALSSLSCEKGTIYENRLIRIINEHNGGLVRYEPLGEYENGREITIDGAIGFYHGVAYRLANCGSSGEWRNAWEKHLNYLDENGGKLHKNALKHAVLPDEFTALRDSISHRLNMRGGPHSDRIKILEAQLTAWAIALSSGKKPAYGLSLSLLTLQGLEFLGYTVNGTAFCEASRAANIPDLNHWCGFSDLGEFLTNFSYNKWEYRFQRASWETPDGRENLETPALDFIRASAMQYKGFVNNGN